ncbi:MAG TPA: hypothetical protein GX521_08640 [Firmicutes bacterium]|nr:hypothetical protein [Bacillota bacterium]
MLIRKIGTFIVISIVLACFAPWAAAETNRWQAVHGSVLQIFPEANKIMLWSDGKTLIFVLEPDCEILRQGCPVALESLRPITSTDFQDALCLINPRGLIDCIFANYFVCEKGGNLISLDIFGNVK